MREYVSYCFYGVLFLPVIAAAHRIELVPITLQEGKDYTSSVVFAKNADAAESAEVDLSLELHKSISQGYANGNVFVLFYNFVQASGCDRDYVVQTVKLTKRYYDWDGMIRREKSLYLVEAMRLNPVKLTRKPDQHFKRYALGNAYRRELVATYEVGCGKIPGVVDGKLWPFKSAKNYRRLQDYSEWPGLYDRVKFDFSRSYSLKIRFDAEGKLFLQIPDFLSESGIHQGR